MRALVWLALVLGWEAAAIPFTVLHTNDLHSHFEGTGPDGLFTERAGDGDPVHGHYARLATLVRQVRREAAERGEPVLLLDAGDFFSGSLFHALGPRRDTAAAPELEFFETLGYDAVTLGNHEFDAGEAGLATMLEKLKLRSGLDRLVVSNRRPTAGAGILDEIPTEAIREITYRGRPVRVGILGYLGPDAARVSAGNRATTRFVGFDDGKTKDRLKELTALAAEQARRLRRDRGADLVIALIHGGDPEDRALAETGEFDLIVAGHTHQLYSSPRRVGRAWVVQAGSYGRYLGRLELEWTGPGGLSLRNAGHTYLEVDDGVSADEEILDRIREYRVALSDLLRDSGFAYDTPVARFETSLTREQTGRLVTSAVRHELNRELSRPVDVYFTSLSLVRETVTAVGQGPTPYQFSDVFRMLPIGFGRDLSLGSPVVTTTLSRRDFLRLVNFLEVYRWVTSDFAMAYSDSLSYRVRDWGVPFVNRMADVRLHGRDIREFRWIRVATNAFLAAFFPQLKDLSYGLLQVQPRDEQGNPVDAFQEEDVPSEPFLLSRHLKRRS